MRRNLFLLACCQAIGQAGNTAMFAATALSVVTFYPNRDLATLPVTMQHVGVMLSVFPAALLMQRFGRSIGFRVGSLTGMLGSLIVGLGLLWANFIMMCAGGLILGYAVANLQMYRFAATELVPASHTAKAISWVTAGGVVAGFIGPSMVRWTHDKWVPTYLATYAGMIAIHAVVFTIMAFIKFPKSGQFSSATTPSSAVADVPPPRPLAEIARQPKFIVAVISGMAAFGTMSLLMGASPLAIVACGLPHTEAHWVIFMHVLGMFAPSFFTGNLIARYGVLNIMLLGIVVLLGGIAAGIAGLTEWHFRASLALNGIGWNFLFVGATTLVTQTYRPNERGKVQALNDFLVFGTTATSSFLAGILQEHVGWHLLNWFSILLISTAIVAVSYLWLRKEPPPSAMPGTA